MNTIEVIGALSVAHDALIEGRDPSLVLRDAPAWGDARRQIAEHAVLVPRTMEEYRESLIDSARKYWGDDLDTSEHSLLGVLFSVQAKQLSKLHDEIEMGMRAMELRA